MVSLVSGKSARLRIRLRPGKDLSIGDKLEVSTRQSALGLRVIEGPVDSGR
jgi:hypothetical protein